MKIVWVLSLLLFAATIDANNSDKIKSLELQPKRILVLFSYSPTSPTFMDAIGGIQSVLTNDRFTIDIEFLNSKHYHTPENTLLFYQHLAYKMANRPSYHLVMTADDNALNFALQHRDSLFKEMPIVFFGLNNLATANLVDADPLVTGVVETLSIQENLALVKKLQPKLTNIVALVDDSPTGQADLEKVLKYRDNIQGLSISVINAAEYSWDELAERLQQLDDTHAIFMLSAYHDKNDVHFNFKQAVSFIKGNTDVPIYYFRKHGFGTGILGGVQICHKEQAKQASFIVKDILNGKEVSDIPVLFDSPNRPNLDYHELKEHGINMSSLPLGSVVINSPNTWWKEYKGKFIVLIAVAIFLLGLLVFLAVENRIRKELSDTISENSRFLRLLVDTIPDNIIMKSVDGTVLMCNESLARKIGQTPERMEGKSHVAYLDGEFQKLVIDLHKKNVELGKLTRSDLEYFDEGSGLHRVFDVIDTPVYDKKNSLLGYLTVSRDITEHRLAEKEVRVLSQALEQSPVAVYLVDLQGKIQYVNQRFEEQTGFAPEEVLGQIAESLPLGGSEIIKKLIPPVGNCGGDSKARCSGTPLERGEKLEGEVLCTQKNGEEYWVSVHITPVLNEKDGEIECFVVIEEDITEGKKQREEIFRRAYYDNLTSLPNRASAMEILQNLMALADKNNNTVALLYIDLDDFKNVNDSLGHDVGDLLLESVAKRFPVTLRENDRVCRIGGDEFIVLLSDLNHVHEAHHIAQRINESLAESFVVEQHNLQISSSIGIAFYPQDCQTAQELFRCADAAMYLAKREGGDNFACFTNQLNEQVHRRFKVELELRTALEKKEFSLVYQPQLDLQLDCVTGLEVLLRWKNSELGVVSPDEFIPIAENSGAITKIGRYVIETAIKEISELKFEKLPNLSINFSPRQFRDSDLVEFIQMNAFKYHYPLNKIEVEITEGVLMDNHGTTQNLLKKMSSLDLKLALDDFGTGYASMSYLRRYPFSTLKIDREFIEGVVDNNADRQLVHATISIAKGLDIKVVAEGVETEEQVKVLKDWGCNLVQGYHYSKPVAIAELKLTLEKLTTKFLKNIPN
jgi:diguanylate cyclase (GGDEF)-like protein/PAS domain S-box-containing protein